MNGELHQIEVKARNNKNEMRREVGKSWDKAHANSAFTYLSSIAAHAGQPQLEDANSGRRLPGRYDPYRVRKSLAFEFKHSALKRFRGIRG